MSNWKNLINVRTNTPIAQAPAEDTLSATLRALLAAGDAFEARTDAFAVGKAYTCRDIAKRAQRGWASDKQRDFALKLIEWSKPLATKAPASDAVQADIDALTAAVARWEACGDVRKADIARDMAAKLTRFGSFVSDAQERFARDLMAAPQPVVVDAPAAPVAPAAPTYSNALPFPQLFAVMQKHATLRIGDLKVSRKNQDSWCWIVWKDTVVGKLVDGRASVWPSRVGKDVYAQIMALLAEIESDPLATAQKYGKLSGSCCSCGRDLTDPESIAAGIGPICAGKFA